MLVTRRVPRMATGTTVAPEFSASQATPLLMVAASPLPRVPSGQDPDATAGVEQFLAAVQGGAVTGPVHGHLAGRLSEPCPGNL